MMLEVQPSTTSSIAAARLHRKLAALGQDGYDLAACERYAAQIDEINRLKAERGAVVLAHNYQRPEIFEVADFIGDSLELAYKAREVRDAGIIVFCGVHFMAETAKVFNPERMVLLPDLRAGCSLAESVTAEALAERKAELREIYPDLKVVSYVNCTADVKAESDACCTSANALKVVEAIDSEHVLFVPDQNLANYVQSQTSKKIISWDGNCYVHHQITAEEVDRVKRAIPASRCWPIPNAAPTCCGWPTRCSRPARWCVMPKSSDADKFLIVTECGLSDRLLMEIPEQALLQGVQALPLYEDDHARRHARFAAQPALRDRTARRRARRRAPRAGADARAGRVGQTRLLA